MKQPLLRDAAFLQAVQANPLVSADTASDHLQLWWLGQSGFLVRYRGTHLLLDPYLSDSLTRKYATTDKPHVRISARVVDPAALDFIDVVLSSHGHTDHLDPDTLQAVARVNPRLLLVCPESQCALAQSRSCLSDERLITVNEAPCDLTGVPHPVRIHPIPSAHEGLDRNGAGQWLCLGFVIELGPHRIYHSGDTIRYPGMVERLRDFRVDLALLPINGRQPERRVAGNLTGPEAAQLAHDIGARCVIPCHFDMFEFNTADTGPFEETCRRLGQSYRILQQGEGLVLETSTGRAATA